MSKKKPTEFEEIISLFKELKKLYPAENLGWHISLATADYPDLCTVSDRELLFAFQKYQAERELDVQSIASEEYVRKIQEDAEHLFDEQDDSWEEEF